MRPIVIRKAAHDWWKSLRTVCTDKAEEARILSLVISKAREGILSLENVKNTGLEAGTRISISKALQMLMIEESRQISHLAHPEEFYLRGQLQLRLSILG